MPGDAPVEQQHDSEDSYLDWFDLARVLILLYFFGEQSPGKIHSYLSHFYIGTDRVVDMPGPPRHFSLATVPFTSIHHVNVSST